jgi:uncharacterized protein (TIGR02302 family)
MADRSTLLTPVLRTLRRPLTLTWAGLIAERVVRAFWPLWIVVAVLATAVLAGLPWTFSYDVVWGGIILAAIALIAGAIWGARQFKWPKRAEAIARMDAVLPGHPLASLGDTQAIGREDSASEDLWQAHQRRMKAQAAKAHVVEPDLKISNRDPFGLRYIALLGLVLALLFGSVLRDGPTGLPGAGGDALAAGPTWEGWVEPPVYTGMPSLYLNDIESLITAPEGSRVSIRLYGEKGVLSVVETVSGQVQDLADSDSGATDSEQNFIIAGDGDLRIEGAGGREWSVVATKDTAPLVALLEDGARTTFDGQMSQPFKAIDDYGITGGRAVFTLDLARIERTYGLAREPETREPIVLELPMPIAGSTREFTEALIENMSEHPWAHMPVTLTLEVVDERGQSGKSEPLQLKLPARRFFDSLAASLIEMRRDLLWTKANGRRVTQVLRAISYQPEPGLFRKDVYYLKLRVILKRLERLVQYDSLTDGARDEIATALWDLAVQLEDGDIEDALERMRMAQERLNQAMKNGANEDEIAELMQELRDATRDYLRQKSQQAQRENNADQPDQGDQNRVELSQQDLQDMMDRIQELMEQGRFAEAQQALEEFQEMMENLRMTEGGEGQSEGQQAMEGLSDTLRQQQGLSDQAFRDLQEQYNPNTQSGQSQENEGQNGGQGRGQSHDGQGQGTQGGEGQNGKPQPGGQAGSQEGSQDGSLADRQEALRRELERQRGSLPGAGTPSGDAARDALERAGRAMDGAENALRNDDLAEAIDRQAEAMNALRDGMRSLGEAMAEQQNPGGQGQARGQSGGQQSDPLGRTPGNGRQAGTQENLLQGEDVYRRARDLLDEIQRRSGESGRPEIELEYLQRLLDRF